MRDVIRENDEKADEVANNIYIFLKENYGDIISIAVALDALEKAAYIVKNRSLLRNV